MATISDYLPGEVTDYASYGGAMASLHNAGARREILDRADPFVPLSSTRQSFEFLAELDKMARHSIYKILNSLENYYKFSTITSCRVR